MAVIGSSGSGKSSVVLAGLIPKLREAGSWLIESFRPNKQPFYELAAALISQLEPELGKTDKTIKAKELAESIRQHGFTADVSAILKDNPRKRLLLVVDQFEELYSGCAATEQQQFVDALLAAVESASQALTLVLTLRADFYSYAVNYPPFTEALNNYPAQNLTLMKAEEMLSAIERPAQKLGVKLENGLTQRILDDVKQEPGNLPLLEFALTQLWEKQSRELLTHQAYSEIGGVAKALSNHAEAVYGKLSEQEQRLAQRLFVQLVRPGEGTENTRRVAVRGEVGNWELVTCLADARLVVTGRDEQTKEETVEVVHEALIQEWERLREWIESDREFRTWQERLRAARHQWETSKNDEGALLRGTLLANAEYWLHQRSGEISQPEREFIQMSLALRDRLLREEEARIQRQLDLISESLEQESRALEQERRALEQEKKARRAAQRTTFVTALSTVVLVIIGGIAWQKSEQARFNEILALAVDGSAKPELLSAANHLLTEAENLSQSDKKLDIKRALSNLRAVINLTSLLQEQTQNSQQVDLKAVAKISKQAEKQLVDLIAQERLPQLEKELKEGKIGNERISTDLTAFENQFEEGAVRTTYAILRREFGAKADLYDKGELTTEKETNRMPCPTLKAIQELWRKYTNGKCGWYGQSNHHAYIDSDCTQLNGETLTAKVFHAPNYGVEIERLKSCKVVPADLKIDIDL